MMLMVRSSLPPAEVSPQLVNARAVTATKPVVRPRRMGFWVRKIDMGILEFVVQKWLDAFISDACQGISTPLDRADQQDHEDDGNEHDDGFVAVIAVPDGEVADAATSHQADHGRIGNKAHGGDRD